MTTNTILDEAEQRMAPAVDQARTTRDTIIDSMKDEIGQSHYDQAKKQLPVLERAVAETYQPFIARVASLEAQANAPLPAPVKAQLSEMGALCQTVPSTIRHGIAGWDGLTVPIGKDGQTVDLSVRASIIHGIRVALKNWDGVRSRLDFLKGQVEQYISDSRWPSNH